MKDFLTTIGAVALLTAALVICMAYGIPALAKAYYPEPNHDAYRAQQYHNYLVRKGHIHE